MQIAVRFAVLLDFPGSLILGRFMLIFLRPDIPRVASNDRVKQTPQESQAISLGSIAYYGTYTVNEQEKSLDLKLDGTSYTNQLGQPQKRIVTLLNSDELHQGGKVARVGRDRHHADGRFPSTLPPRS